MRAAAALLAAALLAASASAGGHRFDADSRERVKVIANHVGPFANPSETYRYFSLPFCRPTNNQKEHTDLSGELTGSRKALTAYMLNFHSNNEYTPLCYADLSAADVAKLSEAVHEDYYYELAVDGLPAWGYVGEVANEDLLFGHNERSKHLLYTHVHFAVGYNHKDQITSVNITDDHGDAYKVELIEGQPMTVQFSYSVSWVLDDIPWETRMDRYASVRFLPAEFTVHWLSIINSVILVVLLTAFLSVVLMRVLKDSFARLVNVQLDEEEVGGGAGADDDDSGWKKIYADVFRAPQATTLLAALLGSGVQIVLVVFLLLALSLLGVFHPTKRGAIVSSSIFLYALTSGVNGFVSARVYKQTTGTAGGSGWVWNLILACLVFPVPLLAVFSVTNTVAIQQSSSAALPFDAILTILALYLLVSCPSTIIGGVVGRNLTSVEEPPCKPRKVPREIPTDVPWYRGRLVHLFAGGFLPFSAIYIELHYLFASLWGHRFYSLFGVLLIAMALESIVASFISIALAYFQLAMEDYHWWWRSFFTGASASAFIYVYSIYYFQSSEMYGVLQTTTFFGYMAICSYAAALALGSISFFSVRLFVVYVYSNIKSD